MLIHSAFAFDSPDETLQNKHFLQAATTPPLTRQNCFNYSATIFDTDTSNDLGLTTALTLKPGFQCEMDIFTGIARFIFETGTVV